MKRPTYLIPANTKKGMLIFSAFRGADLILLGIGISISFLLLFILGTDNTVTTVIMLAPGLISAFLVLPLPNYHNVLGFFKSLYSFLTKQRIYRWKGWCLYEYENDEK